MQRANLDELVIEEQPVVATAHDADVVAAVGLAAEVDDEREEVEYRVGVLGRLDLQ